LGFEVLDSISFVALLVNEKEAREQFCLQIGRFSDIEKQTSICINRCVDLGRTALYIAAEDDSLVSHSSVPLPVDDFVTRLDDLSMDYCPHYSPKYESSPEKFLESIERFLYVHKVCTLISCSKLMCLTKISESVIANRVNYIWLAFLVLVLLFVLLNTPSF